MAEPKSKSAAASSTIERERTHFKLLLAQNPNYFGTLEESTFKPVKKIAQNVGYEQITCVGYHAGRTQLEATVQIKRPTGYGGDLCKAGTIEYVRFYLDYGDGVGWRDQGIVGFNVHDIPNANDCARAPTKPLAYVASLKIEPRQKVCRVPVLPKVRAILSWQVMPPAGAPNYLPIWGNVLEQHIQIQPWRRNLIATLDLIATAAGKEIEFPPLYEELAEIPIPLPEPPDPPIADLAKLYAAQDKKGASGRDAVEAHRFGLADLHAIAKSPSFDHAFLAAKTAEWKLAGLDLGSAFEALQKASADTSYEELECLGLDTNIEMLAATFRIKRPFGYSGGPCQKGSVEYVAFWADWDDTCDYTYLGTVKISVHDFSPIPADGLAYTALLKVDLDKHRRHCKKPKIGRVRAVLSWNVAPSTTDPDDLGVWGNRIDAHVQVNPGEPATSTQAQLRSIGGIAVPHIDPATGLTDATAVFHFNWVPPDPAGRPCPFAGIVVITGPTVPGMRYGIMVENLTVPSLPQPVANTFKVLDSSGTVETTQTASASGTYGYLGTSANPELILARWFTPGGDESKWRITLQLYDPADNPVGAPVSHVIQLKNTGIKDARIHIDPVSGGDCHKFVIGDPVDGHFTAVDDYLGAWSLSVLPFAAPGLTPTSGNVSTPTAPADIPFPLPGVFFPPPGGSPWHIDTTGMQPCGYVVLLQVSDRAIINSAWVGHTGAGSVGWCLDEELPE